MLIAVMDYTHRRNTHKLGPVLIARDIIRDRERLSLTQAELARRAGIRPETLNRIERMKTSPATRILERIDKALSAAEKVHGMA